MIGRLQEGEVATPFEPGSLEEQLGLLAVALGLLAFVFAHRAVRRFLEPRLLSASPQAATGDPARGPRAFEVLDLVGVLFLFFAGQVLVPAGYAIVKTGTLDVEPSFFRELPIETSLGLGAGAMGLPCLYLAYLAFARRRVLAAIGVVGHVRGAKSTYSLARYVALFPAILGLGLVTQLLYGLAGLEPPTQEVALQIQESLADASPWLVVFAVGVVPLIEEILFRGFLLEFVRERAGDRAGILVSSALFALLHGSAAALPIFGLACLLASIKLRTRSLYAAWLIHAVHNGLQTFLLSAGVSP